jgi:cyclohexadienyl dehydratase
MSFMKSIAVAAALIAAPIAGQAQSTLQDVLNSGVLKVGTTGDWNPMTMRDVATNSYIGYDIDVMTALAEDLGVAVEFVPADWRTLVAGIGAGTYHMTGSASVTPSRARVAGYSTPYFSLGTVPLINV